MPFRVKHKLYLVIIQRKDFVLPIPPVIVVREVRYAVDFGGFYRSHAIEGKICVAILVPRIEGKAFLLDSASLNSVSVEENYSIVSIAFFFIGYDAVKEFIREGQREQALLADIFY